MKTLLISTLFLFYSFIGLSQLFGPQIVLTGTTTGASDVHSADIDGDGDMDVLSASYGDDKIAWYENDGTGIFSNQLVISTQAEYARSIFTADIDGDGDLDVLSASAGDDKIAWYENDGMGNFSDQLVVSTQADEAYSVTSADLDGDGDMDVLSASSGDDKIAWYENDGNGNFSGQLIISIQADGARSVTTADLDGDGDVDVLSASIFDPVIVWYENDGTGNFSSPLTISTLSGAANSIITADVNGDGHLDVLVAFIDKIVWYENDGNGVFDNQPFITTQVSGTRSISTSDVDGDGDLDVLSASSTDDKIAWYENDGTGAFGSQYVISNQTIEAQSVTTADLDGDGDMDVLSASFQDGKIASYQNNGDGSFSHQRTISSKASLAKSVSTADVDGDGDMDILSASSGDDKIAWYENDGNGNLLNQKVISTQVAFVNTVSTVDLDGDEDMDVLSASFFDDYIAWYENDGSGNFSSQMLISTQVNDVYSVNTADLDGDGDMDVLSASSGDDKIAWYENDGNGNFGSQLVISSPEAYGARDVFPADLDGDGDIDVLSAFSTGHKIAWYENDGDGNFGSQMVISTEAYQARSVAAADLDEDGDLDVLSASSIDHKIAWYENDGDGNFGSQMVISTQAHGAQLVTSEDLDGDGDMDVLSASPGDDKIAWYENDGTGNFSDQLIISIQANSAQSVTTADLDGDGDVDVFSASSSDHKIAWYENLTGEGCMDTEACNFNSEAWIENGSCCFSCGCTNNLATNFNQANCSDDGTCTFKITGKVFYDENENGIMDEEEYGLPFQNVFIEALGMSFITNDQGDFIANIGNEQIATFELQENPVFPFNTTPNPVTFDAETAESTQILFGISNEVPAFAVCIDLYPNGNGFLCNDYANHNMCFRNMGNLPIDGIIELEYDSLFQGHQEVTEIDSIDGNTVYMSFENLLPGEMFFYDIELLTPTVDHIGEFVTSVAKVYGYFEEEQVAYGEQELTMEITCAYDPNDKQAFPLGYTDEHWLLPETEQEFLVRFQNTGNAPAQDVRIQDTIDVNYDLSTFKMVANSHSVMTSINEQTRVIDFFFQNIQLPDSVNNEPDSHGLVSYAITPYSDLPVGTELNNTAFIYFDNNEAIVTNTTWTTIHECGGEAAFETSVTEVCVGETIDFSSTYAQIETHQWSIETAPEITEAAFSNTFPESGEYIIQLVAENLLCSASSMQLVSVYENPSSEFEHSDLEICSLDFIDVQATGDFVQDYEWYLESDLVGTEQTESIQIEGAGEHEIKLITHNEICQDLQTISVLVNPIPGAEITENGALLNAGEGEFYLWFLNGELIPNANEQSYEVVQDGAYSVIVINEHWCSVQSEEIMVVNISEVSSPIVLLYPNPLREKSVLEFKDSSPRSVRMIDSQGKEEAYWGTINTDRLEIYKAGLSIGNYSILVTEAGKTFVINLLVE